MDVTVLGATGRTGRLVVAELLRRGHGVTALVRDADSAGLPDAVRTIIGDATDPASLRAAVARADAVVSALGPTAKDRLLHRTVAPLLVAALRDEGVSRFVGVSGAGVDAPGDRKRGRDRVISALIHRLGGDAARDKEIELRTWLDSGLAWTLVRPPRLKDGDATGRLEHDAVVSTRSTTMTRGDLAAFLVDVLEQDLYPGAAPFAATAGSRS